MAESPSSNTPHKGTAEPDANGPKHSLCSRCDNPGTLQCFGCKCSRYCSPACQKSDWPTHKLLCAKLKEFDEPSRPSTDSVRAIYFPLDGPAPEFIWIKVRLGDTIRNLYLPVPTSFPPAALPYVDPPHYIGYLEANPILKRSYPGRIGSWSPGLLMENWPQNKSCAKIDKALPKIVFGPVIYFGMCRDLDTVDFCNTVDHTRDIYWKVIMDKVYRFQGQVKVEAIRLNCLGDININDRPAVEKYLLPVTWCDDEVAKKLPLGDEIELPLVMRNFANPLAWRKRKTNDGTPCVTNEKVAILDPLKLGQNAGSVGVVRKDKKPILLPHMMALLDYCTNFRDQANSNPHHKTAGINFQMTQEEIASDLGDLNIEDQQHPTKEGFAAFYKKWIEQDKLKEYRSLFGPYDI